MQNIDTSNGWAACMVTCAADRPDATAHQFVEIDCSRRPDSLGKRLKRCVSAVAPAIGIAAAYGVCSDSKKSSATINRLFTTGLAKWSSNLAMSRAPAVNLFWALKRMSDKAEQLLRLAKLRSRRRLARGSRGDSRRRPPPCAGRSASIGAALLQDGQGVLTHCNAGGLATSDYGTALAVFFAAAESGKTLHVYVDETRPLPPRRKTYRLGTSAAQDRRHADLRLDGRSSDA